MAVAIGTTSCKASLFGGVGATPGDGGGGGGDGGRGRDGGGGGDDGGGGGDDGGSVIGGEPGVAHLFFTDLTSGPDTGGEDDLGAFITLYGEGFGAERGDATVTIGGDEVARYVRWGDNDGPARELDTIVVQPGPDVSSGDIVIHRDGRSSNSVPFTVRSGSIYLVDHDAANASDSNAGTFAAPFETLDGPRSHLSSGDIVYVRGGAFSDNDPRAFGWDCVLCLFPDIDANGTADSPVAWVGYPGEPPTLGGPAPMRRAIRLERGMSHVTIANFRFTHAGGMIELVGTGHRLVGNAFVDGIASYVIGVEGNSGQYQIYGNLLRDNGTPGDKMNGVGLYLQGFGTNRDIDFGWNQIQDQHGSRPIQVYGHLDGDRVEDIRIHDNLIVGSELNAIVLGGSDGGSNILGTIRVYNNVIAGADDPGIRVNDPQGTVILQNNVLYDNGSPGINGSQAQIYLERAGDGLVTAQGNILYAMSGERYFHLEGGVPDGALRGDHNLVFGGDEGCPGWDASCRDSDPLFTDARAHDFRLGAGSPAIDSGADTGVGADFAGTARPQGQAFDIGIYEYVVP